MTEVMRPALSASIWFIIFMASMMHSTWPTLISSPILTKAFAPGEGVVLGGYAHHRDVRQIGRRSERVASLAVGQVYLDERKLGVQQHVAQHRAGVGGCAGVDDHERRGLDAVPLHAIDQLVFVITL